MLASERHNEILDLLTRTGSVLVNSLAERFGVSEMTVRRDLDKLATRGLLTKVHGGATVVRSLSAFEPGFAAKQQRQQNEKQAIARAALRHVPNGATIALTAGTTTWNLARAIEPMDELTVITNAPSIARELYALTPSVAVLLTGGMRTKSDALVGPLATSALSQLHIDILFMGVHGMAEDLGYSTPNLAEAEMNQAFISASRQVVVLADHTKWDTRGLAMIAPLDAADMVITDEAVSPVARESFADHDVRLLTVDSTGTPVD